MYVCVWGCVCVRVCAFVRVSLARQFLKAIAELGTVNEAGNIVHLPDVRLGVRYVSYPAIGTSGETARSKPVKRLGLRSRARPES